MEIVLIAAIVLLLAISAFYIATGWIIFEKAGQPGWASIIPIYSAVVMCWIAGKPGWWVLLLLIPLVNLVIYIMICLDLARNFGKETGFAVGLILLPLVFFPILAFGDARYQLRYSGY